MADAGAHVGRSLFVTPNAVEELTGGGIYARSILRRISNDHAIVTVVCKMQAAGSHAAANAALGSPHVVRLRRRGALDVIARMFGVPTFLGIYIPKILLLAAHVEELHLQNARLGALAWLYALKGGRAKVTVYFDNIESLLVRRRPVRGILAHIYAGVEWRLCRVSEILVAKSLADVECVTPRDARYLRVYRRIAPARIKVHPILIESRGQDVQVHARRRILFTGNFGFWPNRVAADGFVQAVQGVSGVSALLSGAKASSLAVDGRVEVLNNPSDAAMVRAFDQASVFFAPHYAEGGMKTKVAEALERNLVVVATPGALVGYESAGASAAIVKVDDIESARILFESDDFWHEVGRLRRLRVPRKLFEANYCA